MTVIHILIGMFNFFLYRNVLFMNSNMMHMLPTVHITRALLKLERTMNLLCY